MFCFAGDNVTKIENQSTRTRKILDHPATFSYQVSIGAFETNKFEKLFYFNLTLKDFVISKIIQEHENLVQFAKPMISIIS